MEIVTNLLNIHMGNDFNDCIEDKCEAQLKICTEDSACITAL